MNTLASGLIWGGVQVSVLVLAGCIVYALLRRHGPAAGSLAALATLVIAIGMTALALSPWPTWWRVHVAAAATNERPAPTSAAVLAPPAKAAAAATAVSSRASQPAQPNETRAHVDAAAWARTFWTTFWDDLGKRPAVETKTAPRWPAIAAWLLFAGMTLGFARLLLGLAAVGRCRRRTKPIADAALRDLLEVTRARLGCCGAIELRESAEIASPATVGWRRPLVLLPAEWRSWSERELTVVLAHEVAHVRRGDFFAALVSQFTVALHFYNPLVHWLARQLRVEQELAADAWGATLSGGSTAYLTTLAGMALRQDDRRTIWAARQFLPTRGTLMRRIEMLRDHKQPKTFAFSKPKQVLLWTAALAIGLLIAGLRGPDGSTASLAAAQADGSSQSSASTSTKGVGKNSVAEAPNGQKYRYTFVAREAAAPERRSLSLDFVPENAELVAAARVNELAASPALRMLQAASHQQVSDFEKKAGCSLGDIEQLTFVGGHLPDGSWRRTIVRANKPLDWTKFAATIVNKPVAVDSPLTALTGKRYYKSTSEQPLDFRICYIVPDDRTIIFGPESEMNWVMAELVKPPATAAWAGLWAQASGGATAIMVDIASLRKTLVSVQKGRDDLLPYLSVAGPVWTDSQRVVIGTDLGDKKLGLLVLDQCASAASAERVEQTTKALMTLAGNGLGAAEKMEPQAMSDGAIKKVFIDAAAELVKQAKVSHDGDTVAIRSEANGGTLLTLSSIMLPATAKSRQAAERIQSLNNMKQIAMAMQMYNADHGHLPPAVVMGPDGKTPHSWRVELLPYLGEAEVGLYHKYKMNEPWDSPANKKVLPAASEFFHSAEDSGPATNASFFVLIGKGTMFSNRNGIKLSDVTGGLSNTIMIVDAKRDIPWTKPEDIDYDPAKPVPELGFGRKLFSAAFGDGSVRILSKDMNEQALRGSFSISSADKVFFGGGLQP